MMNSEVLILMITAASIGLVHTALGPDHYIPFIALSKSESWSNLKTSIITLICGFGHVLSSIVLGVVGYLIGSSVFSLESIEAFRANIAGWLLIIFGLLYTIWGLRQAYLNKKHTHIHIHEDGTVHKHDHNHHDDHAHLHQESNKNLTPWLIFIIFILGPCEPLIPLLIYPAAEFNAFTVFLVASVFTLVTLFTMQIMVFTGLFGISFFNFTAIQKHIHTLAGISILFCGISIQFLGL